MGESTTQIEDVGELSPSRARRVVRVASDHPWMTAFFLYLLLSVALLSKAWVGGPADTVQFATGDQAVYLWGLEWVPHAITSGQNPFFTDLFNYPDGVNLLNNTASLLLGIVLSPVTLAFGPIASYNVGQTLAFAGSGLAMYGLVGRWTTWKPAAFLGGLLYAFSAYMISSGLFHLTLLFAVLPPLIVIAVDELLVRQERSPWKWGVVLGLLVTAQFFVSAEMLAGTAIACAVGALLLALLHRGQAMAHIRHAAKGLATAVFVGAVLLAYPIWFFLYGPQHVSIQVPTQLFSGDLLGPIIPTGNQLVSPAELQELGDRLDGYSIELDGHSYVPTARGYVGLPLLVLSVFIVLRYRRTALVKFFALMTVLMFVAYLGPELTIADKGTGIPLPSRIFQGLPLLESASPDRFALQMFMGLALVLGIGIDRLHRERWLADRVHRFPPAVAGAFAVAVCVIPLLPTPYRMVDVDRPEFFERGVEDALPAGSVLLTYPFPGPLTAETMEWQANADMHYRIVGGYGFVPDEQGSFTLQGNEGLTQEYLASLYEGSGPSRLATPTRKEILAELSVWEVDATAVVLSSPGADDALQLFTDLFERPPRVEGGVALWEPLSPLPVGREGGEQP